MKEWKENIVEKLTEKAKSDRVIYFKEFANKELNINHIAKDDMNDIVKAFLKANPEYKAYHDISNPTNSLFCGLILAEKEITFDEEE